MMDCVRVRKAMITRSTRVSAKGASSLGPRNFCVLPSTGAAQYISPNGSLYAHTGPAHVLKAIASRGRYKQSHLAEDG